MPDTHNPAWQLPPGPSHFNGGADGHPGDSISFGHFIGVLRRRYRLVLIVTLIGVAIGGYLAAKSPASYRAVAVLRFAGERRGAPWRVQPRPPLPPSADPIPSGGR